MANETTSDKPRAITQGVMEACSLIDCALRFPALAEDYSDAVCRVAAMTLRKAYQQHNRDDEVRERAFLAHCVCVLLPSEEWNEEEKAIGA